MSSKVYLYILVMAAVTYLIRVLPLVVWKKEIKNKFVKSFLYYVPYACLGAMTFPAVIYVTGNILSGLAGFATAVYMAYREKSLLVVALSSCVAVFIVERIIAFM